MNSTKFYLLILGILCTFSVYSFTVVNLPNDNQPIPETEDVNLSEVNSDEEVVIVSDNTNVAKNLLVDTILIDLSEEKMENPFPNASRNCIIKQVPYPDFAREKKLEGGVAVRFQFDGNGSVTVLEANSSSPELEQYVRYKLANLQLKNCVVEVNKDYYLRFMFRLI